MNSGYLTPEIINAALDELWYGRRDRYSPPGRSRYNGIIEMLTLPKWGDRHGYIPSPRNKYGDLIYPVSDLPPVFCGIPELDWTVSASGWKLVIENGAMKGITRE